MVIKFVSLAGTIARQEWIPYGRSIQPAKRVPRPVRAIFESHTGPLEVDWDTKTRTAHLVPFWNRSH